MLKQIIAVTLLFLLSMGLILAMPYAQQGLHMMLAAHEWVSNVLMDVFSGGQTGNLIRQTLALLAIPFFVGLIPVLLFWLARKAWFPYFIECLWVVFLIQSAALIVLYKAS